MGRGAGLTGVAPTCWLKAIGHAAGPLPERWLEDGDRAVLRRTGFPRRPRMVPGDRLVYYASVWRKVFALVEVVGEPVATEESVRWPWRVEVAPLLLVASLEDAPPVEAIGVAPRSMSQQSHIRLRQEHYELAVDAIASIGR